MIITTPNQYDEAKERLADLGSDIADLEELAPGGKAITDAKRLAREVSGALEIYEIFRDLGSGAYHRKGWPP